MDDDSPTRVKVVQLLEVSGFQRKNGKFGIVLQFSHGEDIEPLMIISVWDAQRLLADLRDSLAAVADISGVEDKTASFLSNDDCDSGNEREENGDPDARPWPAPTRKTKGRKRKH